jgi:hypothetical protein
MFRRVMGAIATILIIFLVTYLIYHGLFVTINITEDNRGPYWLVCEKYVGDYKNTGEVMDRVYQSLLDNEKIMASRGFGLYYDNPKIVEKEKLRSIVGCVLEGEYLGKKDELSKKFRVEEIPSSWCVTTAFPYRSPLSIFMGAIRVYPKLGEYLKEKKYPGVPIMEIYDAHNTRIDYIVPVNIDKKYFEAMIAR